MTKNAQKARDYYRKGYWNKQILQSLVKKGFITLEEYVKITEEGNG